MRSGGHPQNPPEAGFRPLHPRQTPINASPTAPAKGGKTQGTPPDPRPFDCPPAADAQDRLEASRPLQIPCTISPGSRQSRYGSAPPSARPSIPHHKPPRANKQRLRPSAHPHRSSHRSLLWLFAGQREQARVHSHAVDDRFPVQMRAGHVPALAHVANQIALVHVPTGLHGERLQVGVRRKDADAVVDDGEIAEGREPVIKGLQSFSYDCDVEVTTSSKGG